MRDDKIHNDSARMKWLVARDDIGSRGKDIALSWAFVGESFLRSRFAFEHQVFRELQSLHDTSVNIVPARRTMSPLRARAALDSVLVCMRLGLDFQPAASR